MCYFSYKQVTWISNSQPFVESAKSVLTPSNLNNPNKNFSSLLLIYFSKRGLPLFHIKRWQPNLYTRFRISCSTKLHNSFPIGDCFKLTTFSNKGSLKLASFPQLVIHCTSKCFHAQQEIRNSFAIHNYEAISTYMC